MTLGETVTQIAQFGLNWFCISVGLWFMLSGWNLVQKNRLHPYALDFEEAVMCGINKLLGAIYLVGGFIIFTLVIVQ